MAIKTSSLNNIVKILNLAERLKSELRHSWMSCSRQESVAEHSWRLSLMLVLLEPHLEQPIDMLKALKMAIIHDLVEAEVGDTPVFDIDEEKMKSKAILERRAIGNIRDTLGNEVGEDIYILWHEFENRQTDEAKLVYALDKLECKLQHVEADLSTWNEKERNISFDWQDELYDFEPIILQLRDYLKQRSVEKVNAEV